MGGVCASPLSKAAAELTSTATTTGTAFILPGELFYYEESDQDI